MLCLDRLIRLDTFLAPILSTTLILNLRRIDDPSLREIMSNLVFEISEDPEDIYNNGGEDEWVWEEGSPHPFAGPRVPEPGPDDIELRRIALINE